MDENKDMKNMNVKAYSENSKIALVNSMETKKVIQLTNKDHKIIKLFNETVKEHDEVRAHIEFAYAHYDEFIRYCQDVAEGNRKPYFK